VCTGQEACDQESGARGGWHRHRCPLLFLPVCLRCHTLQPGTAGGQQNVCVCVCVRERERGSCVHAVVMWCVCVCECMCRHAFISRCKTAPSSSRNVLHGYYLRWF